MKQIIIGLFIMLLVACNQQPVQVTVKMDTPRDTVYVEKIVHDTIIVGKLNKYEKKLIIAMRNKSDANAYDIINQYKYDAFPHKCEGFVQAKRLIRVDYTQSSDIPLKNGVYGFVKNDTLRCDEVKNNTVIKSWEFKRNGTVDTVDVNKGKINL